LNEVKFLIDQIKTTFNGDSWHGPSLMRTLKGVDMEEARQRPLGERHTIWELVDHMTFWLSEVNKTLRGEAIVSSTSVKDWPLMGKTEEEWEKSVKGLEYEVNTLIEQLDQWSNEMLERTVPGTKYNFRQMLHGVLHHNLYHSGQIAILRRKVS
jgi:uncharacterized damage-inducible protein DinB